MIVFLFSILLFLTFPNSFKFIIHGLLYFFKNNKLLLKNLITLFLTFLFILIIIYNCKIRYIIKEYYRNFITFLLF